MCSFSRCANTCTLGSKYGVELDMPVMASIIDYLFKDFKIIFIRCLSLTITLGVIWGGKAMVNMETITKLMNILVFERTPIIYDNGKGNIIVENDIIKDKSCNLLSGDLGERNDFNQFCKIFFGCDNEFMAIGRRRINLTYEVESPLENGPWTSNWLKFLCWCMNKVSMNLTLLTLSGKPICVFFHSRLVVSNRHQFIG